MSAISTKKLTPIAKVDDHPAVTLALAKAEPGWRKLQEAKAELKAIDDRLRREFAKPAPAPRPRTGDDIAADLAAVFTPGGVPSRSAEVSALLARKQEIQEKLDRAERLNTEYQNTEVAAARGVAFAELSGPAFRSHWRPAVRAAAEHRLAYLKRLAPAFAVAGELDAAGLWGGPCGWPLPGERCVTSAADCERVFRHEAAELVAAGIFDPGEPAVTW